MSVLSPCKHAMIRKVWETSSVGGTDVRIKDLTAEREGYCGSCDTRSIRLNDSILLDSTPRVSPDEIGISQPPSSKQAHRILQQTIREADLGAQFGHSRSGRDGKAVPGTKGTGGAHAGEQAAQEVAAAGGAILIVVHAADAAQGAHNASAAAIDELLHADEDANPAGLLQAHAEALADTA